MKKLNELWSPFLTKEKCLIIITIFIFIIGTTSMVYSQSIFSYPEYGETYPHAGLQFFYYLFCVGINPFLFILLMLLMPNLMSYDFLNIHQSQFSYMIETRISKKNYYNHIFIKNICFSFCTVFIILVLLLLIIHVIYFPIRFHATVYPQDYYITAQVLSSNEIISLILFILFTSVGYSVVSSLIFSMQIFITNKYIYRCFGVIFGILLILIPALIQGYIPIPNAAFVLQINNITAIGMENVRTNPFNMSHKALYFTCLAIYTCLSFYSYRLLMKWRESYD